MEAVTLGKLFKRLPGDVTGDRRHKVHYKALRVAVSRMGRKSLVTGLQVCFSHDTLGQTVVVGAMGANFLTFQGRPALTKRIFRSVCILAALFVLATPFTFSQSITTADAVGVITDSSGAVV